MGDEKMVLDSKRIGVADFQETDSAKEIDEGMHKWAGLIMGSFLTWDLSLSELYKGLNGIR